MSIKINFNGEILDDAGISVFDHGFLFGDSIYEVLCTHRNIPCFVDKHLKRLRNSADGISLKIPWNDARLDQEIRRTVEVAANREAYTRIVITRGTGEIDIDPSSCASPNVLIYVTPLKGAPREYYDNGINVALVSIKRNAKDALNPEIKTGNYLNNVLAKMEATRLGAKDALMLNAAGYLTECTTSNFYFVSDGRVKTPSLECGILAGITREIVMSIAQENGILVEEGNWRLEDLARAEEAFATGTIRRVMPVTFLDGKPIGNGKPGSITLQLMRLYDAVLERIDS